MKRSIYIIVLIFIIISSVICENNFGNSGVNIIKAKTGPVFIQACHTKIIINETQTFLSKLKNHDESRENIFCSHCSIKDQRFEKSALSNSIIAFIYFEDMSFWNFKKASSSKYLNDTIHLSSFYEDIKTTRLIC